MIYDSKDTFRNILYLVCYLCIMTSQFVGNQAKGHVCGSECKKCSSFFLLPPSSDSPICLITVEFLKLNYTSKATLPEAIFS